MSALAARATEMLAEGITPQAIIARLTPPTKAEAVHAARRLPLLAERPDDDRGAAIARLATRIGMRQHRIFFTPDGRVADDPAFNRPHPNPKTRELEGDGCSVTYTARYSTDRDHFQLLGPSSGEPNQWCTPRAPIPLSETGYWSHFAEPDAVIAMGGPVAYLAALQAAGRDGQKAFEQSFTGERAEVLKARKPAGPVVGKHTAMVSEPEVAERTDVGMERAEEPKASAEPEPPAAKPAGGWEPPKVAPKVQRSLFE